MRPMRKATSGEDLCLAQHANQREPPTTMGPAPSSDEEIPYPGHQETWGQPLGKNKKNTIRICFQNVGGILPENDGDQKVQVLCQFTQQNQIDAFSFAEHNISWDLLPKAQQMAKQMRGWWENAHWTTAFNKQETNPILHQPGGTRIAVFNALSHKALKLGGDEMGLGRWSWVRLRGQSGQVLCIVSAYRPCYSVGPLSTYNSTYATWQQTIARTHRKKPSCRILLQP